MADEPRESPRQARSSPPSPRAMSSPASLAPPSSNVLAPPLLRESSGNSTSPSSLSPMPNSSPAAAAMAGAQSNEELPLDAFGGGRLYMGVRDPGIAASIVEGGVVKRPQDRWDHQDFDGEMKRNGAGLYLSQSPAVAASFSDYAGGSSGRVVQFDNVDFRALTSVHHMGQQHTVLSSGKPSGKVVLPKPPAGRQATREERAGARRTVAAKFGAIDLATGVTEGKGARETIVFSEEALAALNRAPRSLVPETPKK